MYDHILLATDGDAGSQDAVNHAIELAATHEATLHALFVVDTDVYSAYSGDEYLGEHEGLERALERHGEDAVGAVRTDAAETGVSVVEAIEHGHPSETIVDYADEHDIDLVVVGTKHHTDEYRRLLGSVTERVVRFTPRPVTVVKTRVEDEG